MDGDGFAHGRPSISAEEVRTIARLARLALDERTIAEHQRRLAALLDYVERLRAVDVEGVEPMAHVGDPVARLDPDEPGGTLPAAAALGLAPDVVGPFIRVPRVLDEGSSA